MTWIVFALMASVLIGADIVVRKKALIKDSAIEFMSIAAIVTLLAILPLSFFATMLPARDLFLILLKSFFAMNFFFLADRALKKMDVSAFAPLANLSPILLVFIGYFFLGEKLTTIQLAGVALTIVGAYVLELKKGIKDLKQPFVEARKSKYLHLVFLGLIFAAIAASLDRFILRSVGLLDFYFYQALFISLFVFIYLFVFFDGVSGIEKGYKKAGLWVVLASVLFLLADYFYFKALTMPTAFIVLVIAVKRLSSLFATLLGGEIFHEKNLLRKSLACGIMLAGVFLIIS